MLIFIILLQLVRSLILWVEKIKILLEQNFFKNFTTIFSFFWSNEDVASSNINISGFLNKALAIPILWIWPPEIRDPFSPIFKFLFNSDKFNFFKRKSMYFSSFLVIKFPKAIFDLIDSSDK